MDWLCPYGDECGGSVLVMGKFVPHGEIRFVGGGAGAGFGVSIGDKGSLKNRLGIRRANLEILWD